MKEFKGTKGKWCVENVLTRTGDFYKIKSDTDLSVCNITTRNQSMAYANARLIASAPELAKSLQEAIELFDNAYTCMENGDNEGLYNALANATSRSNFKEVLTKAIGE